MDKAFSNSLKIKANTIKVVGHNTQCENYK